jgi:histone H3/H4
MDKFTKPSITRVVRKAGIKHLSEDSYSSIRVLINHKTKELLEKCLIINEQRGTKTLMSDDVIDALRLSGLHVSKSSDLSS